MVRPLVDVQGGARVNEQQLAAVEATGEVFVSAGAGTGTGAPRERVETVTTCSACGKETTVPFKPTQGRPVFCKECFQPRKFAGAGGV